MQDEKKAGKPPMFNIRMRDLFRWYSTLAALFVIGILSISIILWHDQVDKKQNAEFDIHDAVMDMRILTASAHLWLEEATEGDLEGDKEQDFQIVKKKLDQAEGMARAILKGGQTEHGLTLQSLHDAKRRKIAEKLSVLLTRFKMIALQRMQNPQTAGIGSPLDQEFNAVFNNFEAEANTLEALVRTKELQNRHSGDFSSPAPFTHGYFFYSLPLSASACWKDSARSWP